MSNLAYGEGIYGGGKYGEGGYAPTVPVSADIVATYNIKAKVRTNLIAVYNIVGVIPFVTTVGVPVEVPAPPEHLESFGERIYGLLEPIARDDAKLGYPLNYYVGALGHMFQEVEDLARDEIVDDRMAPGWSRLMDINRIDLKGLDWLSQFVGITINHDDSVEGMRQQLRGHDRWGRGTPLSIISPASKYLPTNAKMYMSERNPNPYHITFIFVDEPGLGQLYENVWETYINYYKIITSYATYESLYQDTPGDWDKVEELLLAAKPAGLQHTFLFTTTILYLAIYILLANYQALYDTYATYESLYSDPFPDIGLAVPSYARLVSARYYRNIYNQFEDYATALNSFITY